MAEAKELTISATGAISGGTNLLNVLKRNKLVKEEPMLHNQRKQRHHLMKQRMCRKRGKS